MRHGLRYLWISQWSGHQQSPEQHRYQPCIAESITTSLKLQESYGRSYNNQKCSGCDEKWIKIEIVDLLVDGCCWCCDLRSGKHRVGVMSVLGLYSALWQRAWKHTRCTMREESDPEFSRLSLSQETHGQGFNPGSHITGSRNLISDDDWIIAIADLFFMTWLVSVCCVWAGSGGPDVSSHLAPTLASCSHEHWSPGPRVTSHIVQRYVWNKSPLAEVSSLSSVASISLSEPSESVSSKFFPSLMACLISTFFFLFL